MIQFAEHLLNTVVAPKAYAWPPICAGVVHRKIQATLSA